jgi:CRP/FNR family cyclic AMP-dependent transcriptional regulator
MISLELLRRYPFFAGLDEGELRAVAMLAEKIEIPAGALLFEEGHVADAFYLALDGSVELSFHSPLDSSTQVHVDDVNPGEPLAISALIPPHILSHTAHATDVCSLIRIDAAGLRALCDTDCKVGYTLMRQVAIAAMERLHYTRVQLVAERA